MALKYTVILLPEEELGYSVICPALPGCVSQGESLEEALANIREAAEGWLVAWLERGNLVPTETPEIVADEIREVLNEREDEGLPFLLETHEIQLYFPVHA